MDESVFTVGERLHDMDDTEALPQSASTVVDVLVLYTPAAAASVANINNTIDLAIAQANQSFRNSEITAAQASVRLVGRQQVSFTEGTNIFDDHTAITYSSYFQSLRNQYHADIVVLMTDEAYGDSYGVAWAPANIIQAYAIVVASRATPRYTFAHELGHLLGAHHQRSRPWMCGDA